MNKKRGLFFQSQNGNTLFAGGDTRKIALFACVRTDAFDKVIFQPDAQVKGDIGDFLTYIRNVGLRKWSFRGRWFV